MRPTSNGLARSGCTGMTRAVTPWVPATAIVIVPAYVAGAGRRQRRRRRSRRTRRRGRCARGRTARRRRRRRARRASTCDRDGARLAGLRRLVVELDGRDRHAVPRRRHALAPRRQRGRRRGAVGRQVDRRRGGRLVQRRRVVAHHPRRRHLRGRARPTPRAPCPPTGAARRRGRGRRSAARAGSRGCRTGCRPRGGRGGRGRGRPRPTRWPSRSTPSKHSSHQPSRMLQLSAPLSAAFMPRRAARLERPARRVQPHVAAVVHRPGDRDVVVGEEHEAVAHVGGAGELLDALDQLLARVVGRVRLAGEHELHRALGVVQQRAAGDRGRTAAAWPACTWRSGGRTRSSAPTSRARPRRGAGGRGGRARRGRR